MRNHPIFNLVRFSVWLALGAPQHWIQAIPAMVSAGASIYGAVKGAKAAGGATGGAGEGGSASNPYAAQPLHQRVARHRILEDFSAKQAGQMSPDQYALMNQTQDMAQKNTGSMSRVFEQLAAAGLFGGSSEDLVAKMNDQNLSAYTDVYRKGASESYRESRALGKQLAASTPLGHSPAQPPGAGPGLGTGIGDAMGLLGKMFPKKTAAAKAAPAVGFILKAPQIGSSLSLAPTVNTGVASSFANRLNLAGIFSGGNK